jgi:hypothetical protein
MTNGGSSKERSGREIAGAGRGEMPVGARMPGILMGPRKPAKPSGPNTRWPPLVQYLTVVGITALFLLLAISLQRHHFMNGEFYDRSHPTDQADQSQADQ